MSPARYALIGLALAAALQSGCGGDDAPADRPRAAGDRDADADTVPAAAGASGPVRAVPRGGRRAGGREVHAGR